MIKAHDAVKTVSRPSGLAGYDKLVDALVIYYTDQIQDIDFDDAARRQQRLAAEEVERSLRSKGLRSA